MRKTFNQKMSAIFFVFLGILLLLINIGVISWEIKEIFVTYYPVVILLFGLKLLIDTIFYHRQSLFLGFFLLIFGSLLVLDRAGLVHFEFNMIWKLWPILIIYIGLKLFLKRRPMQVTVAKGDLEDYLFADSEKENAEKKQESSTKRVITIGDLKMNKQNWSVEPLTIWNVVGDYYFDFSKAYIPDKETTIQIKGMVADLKMLVPEDLPIKIDSSVKVGKLRVFGETSHGKNSRMVYESPNYPEATRKIKIVLDLKVGDVRIDRI